MADQDNPMPMEMGDSPASEAMNSSQKGISPYLIMQAQHELSQGNLDGEGMKQLGAIANQTGAIPPEQAAFHAERAGRLPAGTTQSILKQKMGASSPQQSPSPQTAANPAGAMGSAQGDPETVTPPSPGINRLNAGPNQDTIRRLQGNARGIFYPEITDPKGNKSYDLENGVADPDSAYQQAKTSMGQQQSALDQLKNKVYPRQADLSGLMGMADFLNGTNSFSTRYAKQREQENQNVNQAQNRDQQLLGDQNTLSKEQMDLEKQAEQEATGEIKGTANNQNSMKEYDRFFTSLQGDHLLNDALKAKANFATAQQMVNQNNNVAALMVKGGLLHQAFGRVNQTEYDQAGGDSGVKNSVIRLYTKLNDFMQKNPGADATQAFTPKDQQEFRQVINSLAGQAGGTIRDQLEFHHQDALSKQLDPQQYYGPINSRSPGFFGGQNPAQTQNVPAPAANVKKSPSPPALVTMYKNGQAFHVPKANAQKAQSRGYTLENK